MKNISRTVSRFYVEVMDDWKMDSQSAVLTITDNELRIEGEQILCLPRAQIRKVQPFLNASRVEADPTSGKALEAEPDLALTVASPSGIDRKGTCHTQGSLHHSVQGSDSGLYDTGTTADQGKAYDGLNCTLDTVSHILFLHQKTD